MNGDVNFLQVSWQLDLNGYWIFKSVSEGASALSAFHALLSRPESAFDVIATLLFQRN